MEADATLPDGSRRTLLRINRWDFNWQDEYSYERPMFLPRDSVVSMRYVYDNSADNPRNPDPTDDLTFGVEEMMIGFVDYLVEHEGAAGQE